VLYDDFDSMMQCITAWQPINGCKHNDCIADTHIHLVYFVVASAVSGIDDDNRCDRSNSVSGNDADGSDNSASDDDDIHDMATTVSSACMSEHSTTGIYYTAHLQCYVLH
jgi:hypothetical protein